MEAASETIFLQEEVVLDGVTDLHTSLSAKLDAAEVKIDASDARFIDGAGWQVLVAFSQRHGNAKLVNTPAGIEHQAKTLGMDKLLDIGVALEKATEAPVEDDLCPVF